MCLILIKTLILLSFLLHSVDLVESKSEIVKRLFHASECNCYNFSCSCCSHVEFKKIHLNDTGKKKGDFYFFFFNI